MRTLVSMQKRIRLSKKTGIINNYNIKRDGVKILDGNSSTREIRAYGRSPKVAKFFPKGAYYTQNGYLIRKSMDDSVHI